MDARDHDQRTPLMAAAEHGATACATLLLARFGDGGGEQLGMVDHFGHSATHYACSTNHHSTLDLLLDAGASMTARDAFRQTPLMAAAERGATNCVMMLLGRLENDEVGEQLGMVDNHGNAAAHLACHFNHHSTLALLRGAGASMDSPNNDGRTPLLVAAEYGAAACVTLLLDPLVHDVGEQLGMVDNDGDSTAHLAPCFNHPSTLALLLNAGALMDARNNSGLTPLMMAAVDDGAVDCMMLLSESAYALDLDAQGNDGSTALHQAAYYGHPQIVSLLLDAGADPTIQNL